MAIEDEIKELCGVIAEGFRALTEAIDKRFGELPPVVQADEAKPREEPKPLTRDDIKKQIMKPLTRFGSILPARVGCWKRSKYC